MHRYQELGLVHNSLEDTVQPSTITTEEQILGFLGEFSPQ